MMPTKFILASKGGYSIARGTDERIALILKRELIRLRRDDVQPSSATLTIDFTTLRIDFISHLRVDAAQ
jgi:hypothetical protein